MKLSGVGLRLACSLAALAMLAPASAAEGWHQDYVKSVYPMSNGNFVVTFATSPANCTNGSNPKYFYVQAGHNGVTAEGVKAMLAVSLMAFAGGKKLTIVFDDSSYSCDINRMSVSD
jgi:hypothetical protein